jgi:hypothetical protein
VARRAAGRAATTVAVALAVTGAAAAFGLSKRAPAPASTFRSSAPAGDPLAGLRAWEDATRASTDFAHAETSETALGADPYALAIVVGGAGRAERARHRPQRLVGLLRGRSALVELDASLNEVARLPAPESPTGLAVAADGEIFVVGELSSDVARYRVSGGRLGSTGAVELPGVVAMRDVATGPEGVVYVVEEHSGRLVTLRAAARPGRAPPDSRVDTPLCHGPVRVLRVGAALVVNCLLDHAIVVRAVDSHGVPTAAGEVRIVHDGPMWGVAALPDGDGLLVAVGGVEDHPLDRTEGSFGFIDSFVTLYRVAHGEAVKESEVNTSELQVVTPKALALSRDGDGDVELTAAGYGSGRLALVRWKAGALTTPSVATRSIPPGSSAVERLDDGSLVFANPLLDAWVQVAPAPREMTSTDDRRYVVTPVDDRASQARSTDSRLGEALFFTTLLAPWDRSDGRLSRFTCETCHFEGYVDGRTHFTGRGEVHATTKPLLGLFNNRPHFSRALDPDLTTMVNNEFRVASAKSDHDPWFSLTTSAFPWLGELPALPETLSPVELRRAFMTFLMDFKPRPNPSVMGRTRFTDEEREGAAVFRDRCESCHEARLVTDDPATRVPFDRWEGLVMTPAGALVWAHDDYEMTGVRPYVNEKGARVVSLRRLYKKYPYFTNGSAKSLAAVLDRASFAGGVFFHDGAPEGAVGLADTEKTALAAFLDLL